MEKFDAAQAVDAIERYKVNFCFMAPTMIQRIVALEGVEKRDFSSFQGMYHTAAPCPPWLKREWMKLLGPEKVFEAFGATEGVGATVIRGDEWLEHPGSLGKPQGCDMKILDENGQEVSQGEVGEIFMRPHTDEETYDYIGSDRAKSTTDGFVSVGDMGWVDAEGYLFLADRRVDLIITGGANVYPAEVEAALSEHEQIGDVVVIGVPDEDWGKRVHAVIQPVDYDRPPSVAELDAHCRERLMSYKVPKSYEFMREVPRLPSGKI
jgi:bile acid-coenzyme A ligase